jgi:uncharacterized repeat protein (TIGR01451 family)
MNFFDRIRRSLTRGTVLATLAGVFLVSNPTSVFPQANTFGGDAQHTGIFDAPAQPLNVIKWQTDIDLVNTGELAHYGSPVITPNNTVLVPVRISANGFRVDAFNGATGAFKYSLPTDFIMPSHGWIPSYNMCLVGTRLYFAGAGGTMWHVDNVDSNTPGTPVREVFYTSLANYNTNASAFNNTIFANTPITGDSAGNVFFGFRIQGTAPAPLSTSQSGLARITSAGTASFVHASAATGDGTMDLDSHNVGPALSNDESTVYFVFKASTDAFRSYLVGLNSTTLATKHTVFLRDPRNNSGARVPDDATSSPMVAPDGDVYFGVLANPNSGSRGWLLRYSGDLTVTKNPGAFGWDYTPAIVPASMVPSYTGTSSYLLFCKYNDYAFGDGTGVNRVAILDPNAIGFDAHPSALGLVEMQEVLTLIGPTPNSPSVSFPFSVKEFCINAPAVNPATNSVFFDSEDGRIYRWNLVTNQIDQAAVLSPGLGQPYVPTVIGPDGTVYTLNGGNFFAIGTKPGVQVTLTSSSPDVRNTVVGDTITFTATVSGTAPIPTGTVTFTDLFYSGTTPVTNTLASNVPLDANGRASFSTSSLAAADTVFGNHFITATYSGDGGHLSSSGTLLQKVHAKATTLVLTSSSNPANSTVPVTFTATVSASSGTPTGKVLFKDNNVPFLLVNLDQNGQVHTGLTVAQQTPGTHIITASYVSDTTFAASTGQVSQVFTASIQFSETNITVTEGVPSVSINVLRTGDANTVTTVDYATSDLSGTNACSVISSNASSRCDYLRTAGMLTFAVGETSKTIVIPLIDDAYAETTESFRITLSNVNGVEAIGTPGSAGFIINDNETVNGANPIDNTSFFVRQHYLDFLNREPDTNGFNFWSNEINVCGADLQCIQAKRVNVSAAFFLSIEFQQTGYLVYRIHKSSFGNLAGTPVPITLAEFLAGTQTLGKGVQVGIGNWEAQLEANKVAFSQAFVQRADFLAAYPNSMTATQFVDQLNTNAGGVLSASERTNLINVLGATPADVTKRAQVLRSVAEDPDLANAEFRKAFVLMQYFGYMRRNPNEAPEQGLNFDGYNFWLGKLNQFNGNFVDAELVKAFIISGEYRQRFGQ